MKEEYDKCVITFTAIFLLNLAIILEILGQLFEKKGRKGKFLGICTRFSIIIILNVRKSKFYCGTLF